MAAKLPNYLRSHRLRTGFSQDEIAFLLGNDSGAHVCKYERSGRLPGVRVILGCSLIFDAPAHELFAGISDAVKMAIKLRAKKLLEELQKDPKRLTGRKLSALKRIIDEE
jgi:transcriptional regulator with XRE-family HTH domain